MLETVDQIESSRLQKPVDGRPGELADALRSLAATTSDDDAQRAYHRVLFATGNDHTGSYFPIVLDVGPFLGEILVSGSRRCRARTLDVLIDLVVSARSGPIRVLSSRKESGRRIFPLRSALGDALNRTMNRK